MVKQGFQVVINLVYTATCWGESWICDTTTFGIDPIPSKYRASIANTNTDTFYLEKKIIYFRVGESNAS